MEPKQVQQQVAGERKEKQHQHQHEQQQQQQTVRALVQDGSGEQAAGAGGDEAQVRDLGAREVRCAFNNAPAHAHHAPPHTCMQLWTLLAAVKESFHNGLHLIYNKFSDEGPSVGG